MKKTYLLLAGAALLSLGMTACGGAKEEETAEAAPVTYSLDANASSLKWKGDYADASHSHNGTIDVTEGTVVYNGDLFESGNFTVDMATIMDEDLPAPDKDTLDNHLSGPYFFKTAEFPAAKVTVKSVTDKDAVIVINALGKDVEATVPVTVKKSADKVKISGKFTVDFASLDMQGTKPMDPKFPTQYVKPVINFDLDVVLKAENAK